MMRGIDYNEKLDEYYFRASQTQGLKVYGYNYLFLVWVLRYWWSTEMVEHIWKDSTCMLRQAQREYTSMDRWRRVSGIRIEISKRL